jgi:hypothetical protein
MNLPFCQLGIRQDAPDQIGQNIGLMHARKLTDILLIAFQ